MKTAEQKLVEIVENAPDVPGYGGGKWAIYSVGCCWWTSDPKNLGETGTGDIKLPACPYCKSVLMQAPLEAFAGNAIQGGKDGFYGAGRGVEPFVNAHNAPCHRGWDNY